MIMTGYLELGEYIIQAQSPHPDHMMKEYPNGLVWFSKVGGEGMGVKPEVFEEWLAKLFEEKM